MITFIIGPDEQCGGTAWTFTDGAESWGSDGSPGAVRNRTITGWTNYARRHVKAPRREAPGNGPRLRWTDADVTPHGYSDGPGHCPNGARFVWR